MRRVLHGRHRACWLLLLLGLALGCGARSSVLQPEEGGPSSDGARADLSTNDGRLPPDSRRDVPGDWAQDQARDKVVWPDLKPKDQWPWPTDTYQGTPFGCQADSDCFGQKCCPTPWNVNLCAMECPEI